MFGGLKKLWQEVKKDMVQKRQYIDAASKDDNVVRFDCTVQDIHETTTVDLSSNSSIHDAITPIDKEIATLIAEMNRVGIHTTCSCQGEVGQDGAYISIKVDDGTTFDYRDDTKELTLRWRRRG